MKISLLRPIIIFTFLQLCYSLSEPQKSEYDMAEKLTQLKENIRSSQNIKNVDVGISKSKNLVNFKSDSFNSLLNAFNNGYAGFNNRCMQDLLYVAKNLKTKNLMGSWAWKMLDSFGKPESGLLNGNLKWVGDFDECRSVYAPKENSSENGGFHGKYCSLQVNMTLILATVGICVPATCDPSDFIHEKLNTTSLYSEIGSIISINSFICKENVRHLSNEAIATMSVMSVFIIFTILGSFITIVKYLTSSSRNGSEFPAEGLNSGPVNENRRDESHGHLLITEGSTTKLSVIVEGCVSFLSCFCIFTNGSKLLNVDNTEGQLLCLHGIRFLSLSWVIICHTYLWLFGVLRSFGNVVDEVNSFAFQVILNGWYSVDSFFLLSGFLMAYLYFEEATKRQGKIPWIYFYIHRYIRLTPVYMIALAFYATIFPYLGSGPFWPDYDVDVNCENRWWWNLLYINNFNHSSDQCMGWSWYLANDMQFFVISPLFLISLWRWPKLGYSILGLFLCSSWITCFVLTYHYDLAVGNLNNVVETLMDPIYNEKWLSYFNKIYLKPYGRIAPYLVGIALGYVLFKKKITNFKLNTVHLWTGWSLAIPLGLTCVYGLYRASPNLLAASFFNALIRTCYSLSLAWVILVCLTGQAEVVNKILSYKLFIPLSRLTYCAYLIHPIVITTYIGVQKATLMLSHSTVVVLFFGLILITYSISLLVSLIFESPLIRLEKLIRSKSRS